MCNKESLEYRQQDETAGLAADQPSLRSFLFLSWTSLLLRKRESERKRYVGCAWLGHASQKYFRALEELKAVQGHATAASMDTDPPAGSVQQGMSQRAFHEPSMEGSASGGQDQKLSFTDLAAGLPKLPCEQPQELSIKQECSADKAPEEACAEQTRSPQVASIRPPQSTVTSFLNQNRHSLTSFWNKQLSSCLRTSSAPFYTIDHKRFAWVSMFTNTGFKGLPIPSNETESDRKLREDITRDVYQYFEASSKQLMAQRGQQIPE
eukprot:204193-Pelagomonas_calceolata.AAC.10